MSSAFRMMAVAGLACVVGLANAGDLYTDTLTVGGDATFNGNVRMQQAGVENIPTNGMIVYYNFDTNSSTIPDMTPLSNNATVVGPTYTSAGRRGSCYYFPGWANYMQIKGGALSGISTGSISVWLNVPTTTVCYQFLSMCDSGGGNSFQFRTAGGPMTPYIQMGPEGSSAGFATTTSIPANQWTHIVVTWNMSSAQIYMNGVLIGSGTDAQNRYQIYPNTASFMMGRYSVGNYNQQSMVGYMDDFRVYKTGLSSQQVYQTFVSAQPSGQFVINGAGLVVNNNITQISGNATNSFSGKVGIGTNSPSSVLDVNGATTIRGTLNLAGNSVSNAPNLVVTNDSRNITLDGLSHGSNWWVNGGKFGVGTNVPSEAFHVSGAGRFEQGVKYITPLGDVPMGTYTNTP